MEDHFYWPGMGRDIADHCKKCVQCLKFNRKAVKKEPMMLVETISEPWKRVALDIVGPFHRTKKGNRYILTLMDHGTCYMVTDHRALTYFNKMNNRSIRLTRWSHTMQPYDCVFKYRKGKENQVADYLSRASDQMTEETKTETKAAEDVCTSKKGDVLGQHRPLQLTQLATPTTTARTKHGAGRMQGRGYEARNHTQLYKPNAHAL